MLADRVSPLLRVNPTPMVAMVGLASTQAVSRQRLPRGQVNVVWVPPSGPQSRCEGSAHVAGASQVGRSSGGAVASTGSAAASLATSATAASGAPSEVLP